MCAVFRFESLRFTVPENADYEDQSEQLHETLTNLFNCNLYALPTKAFNTFDQADKLKKRGFAFLRIIIHFNTDIINYVGCIGVQYLI